MTELLERYLEKIERKKEKDRLKVLQKTKEALNKLSEEFTFKEAYIFGSILKKKKFYYDSDVDIAVKGLSNEDFFTFMAKVSDLLEREVDIVQLEKHRLKEKIVREGLLWKKRD